MRYAHLFSLFCSAQLLPTALSAALIVEAVRQAVVHLRAAARRTPVTRVRARQRSSLNL
jgi:hypothetical protein